MGLDLPKRFVLRPFGGYPVEERDLEAMPIDTGKRPEGEELLLTIAGQLANRGFSCSVRLKERAGLRVQTIALNRDYWLLKTAKRSDVARLARKVLRYSLHPEKVDRMKFILHHNSIRKWSALESSWQNLRKTTTEDVQRSRELARLEYESSHQLKVSK